MAGEFDDLVPTTPSLTGSSVTVSPRTAGTFDDLVPTAPRPTIVNPNPVGAAGNSFWYDVIHPRPADLSQPQTWRDWATKTYSPTAKDFGSAALDDITMGGADYAQAKLGGGNLADIRASTARSQAALGPMGPVVAAGGYLVGPGKLLGPLAAIGKGAKVAVKAGRAALEGFGAGAISSEGHDLGSDKSFDQRAWDAAKQGAESAAFGVGGNWAARSAARVGQPVFNAAQGAPGRAGDKIFKQMREASARGEDISPIVEQYQQATGIPMDDVLDAQRIGTGPIASVTRQASNLGARAALGHFFPWSWVSAKPGDVGEYLHDAAVNRLRHYMTQNALDRVYPAYSQRPLNADTSGWSNALRQLSIGASLPP